MPTEVIPAYVVVSEVNGLSALLAELLIWDALRAAQACKKVQTQKRVARAQDGLAIMALLCRG